MSIDLESIQEMWKKDSFMDIDNLHLESLKIPGLHAKYHELYNRVFLLRKKEEQEKKQLTLDRYKYYTGKSSVEVYAEEPFPYKIREKDTLNKYLDGDEKLSTLAIKIEYYNTVLNFLEDILKQLHNRTYQIKNSIEYMKFQSGLG